MDFLSTILNFLLAVFFVLAQQALVIGIGIVVYSQSGLAWGIFCWVFCIPMLWVNYLTFKYLMKYGFIKFFTTHSDTSEIDVAPEDRPFRD